MHSRFFFALSLLSVACRAEVDESSKPAAPASTRDIEIAKPDWSGRGPIETSVLERMPVASRAVVRSSPVPTLAASDDDLSRNAIATSGEHWVAMSSRVDGVTVSVHATRLAYRYADIPPAEGTRALRGQKGFVSREEAIWKASWVENAIAYSVDVECGDFRDRRCGDESYLLGVVERLAFVGGNSKEVR